MQWSELNPIWRTCFELAWESHLEGSNPIAAVIADSDGRIISTGKSAVKASSRGSLTANCEIAHAEINALLAVDNRSHPKAKAGTYTLYVSLEPCPLCFSAFYMSDLEHLVFAAKDRFGGSTNLLGTTPYLSRKPKQVTGPVADLEEVSIFLNTYCGVLRGVPLPDPVHEALAIDYRGVVKLAETLASSDALDIRNEPLASRAFAKIFQALSSETLR